MPEFVDVVVETGNTGVAPTPEVSSRDGSQPSPVRVARAKEPPVDRLKVAADSHAVSSAGRALKDSTREKIAAVLQANRDAQPAEDDEEAATDVEVESVADAVETAEEDDGEPIDAMAQPAAQAKVAAKAATSDVEERLKELEGVTERQRAALERYEAQLAEARKTGEETLAQRTARLEAAETEYLSDPIKALHKHIAAVFGHDDENHDDVKKEVMDLFLDLTSHVGGVTQDPGHLAKRQSDRTRREWEREKKGRAASGKKADEAAAQEQRAKQVDGIIGEIDKVVQPDAEKYPLLTALAPHLDGKTPGRVIYELVEAGIKRGDFKADEPDDVLIAKAAKAAEAYYTKRADPLRSALQPKSTATPTAAAKTTAPAAQVEREKPRTSKEARVTNADASVAPATPPAQKPAPKAIPLQNDEARRKHATRHLRLKK